MIDAWASFALYALFAGIWGWFLIRWLARLE